MEPLNTQRMCRRPLIVSPIQRAPSDSDPTVVPIHENSSAFTDPQSSSPFYNGRIPPEIRTTIFEYALSEHYKTSSSPASPVPNYPENTNYTRPGYLGKKIVDTALLRTCRMIYLETHHIPPTAKEHVFWHTRGPPNHPGSTLSATGEQEILYFFKFLPWQRKLIKEIHLFTQLFWLESTFLGMVKRDFMQGIEKLKITIRRGDWWWNESNHLLGISPQTGRGVAQEMLDQWAKERAGIPTPWVKEGWGHSLSHMQSLKELEMEFETSDDKKEELKAIVAHAKTWKFPAHSKDGVEMQLSADGCEPLWWSWDGPLCLWSDICPYCSRARKCVVVDPPNKNCENRTQKMKEGKGPLCHVVSLRWKLKRKFERS